MPDVSLILASLLLASVAPVTAATALAAEAPAPAVPDTPAGRHLAGWLEAFNGGNPAAMAAWMNEHYPTFNAPPGALVGLREMTGGFDLVRVENAEDGKIVALLGERNWDGSYARLTMDVASGADGKITGLQLQGTGAPADMPPLARTSEPEALSALKSKLDQFSSTDAFSGAVRVSREGETVFEYVSGEADRERGVANTLDTKFRIGSMNKMFTAVSILQLAEAGKIDLDAPIGTYLADYPNADLASRVTVRHLLTHTGGTGDIFGPQFFERRSELCETSDYVALYGSRDVAFDPGERFAYSNYGFVLLGAIVEAVSGQNYYDYVDAHIYTPAGMTASGSLPESVEVPGRSRGYTRSIPGSDGQWRLNTETLPCRGSAAGGGYSTVGDLTRFAEALQTGKLLGPEMLKIATSQQVAMGPGDGYGFGFGTSSPNGTPAFGHSGGAPGMSAQLLVFPQLGYEVAIAANIDAQIVGKLAQYLGQRLPAQ